MSSSNLFPLPASTFPTIKLSRDSLNDILTVRNRLVNATLNARDEYLHRYNGHLDNKRWKLVKKSNSPGCFRVYQPRNAFHVPRPLQTLTCSPLLIGVGSLPNQSLDDIMYGLCAWDNSTLRFIFDSILKDVADARILNTLETPTVTDPFNHVSLKWLVKDSQSNPILKSVVNPRDFIFLEATGISTEPTTQERTGYFVCHSLNLACYRTLDAEYGITRGQMSFCFLFRENMETNAVDVFVKGFVDPRGGSSLSSSGRVIAEKIAVSQAANAIMSCENIVRCTTIKKIAALQSNQQNDDSSTTCNVCDVPGTKKNMLTTCSNCSAHICISCCEEVSGLNKSATSIYCVRCINDAQLLSAAVLAQEYSQRVWGNTFSQRRYSSPYPTDNAYTSTNETDSTVTKQKLQPLRWRKQLDQMEVRRASVPTLSSSGEYNDNSYSESTAELRRLSCDIAKLSLRVCHLNSMED